MIFRKAITQFDFFSLMQIRCLVFVSEQQVDPTIEIDEDDKSCQHYIVEDDGGCIIGTCRILIHDNIWHVGRVAVLKEFRAKHVGSLMLEEVECIARKNKAIALQLGAQTQAKYFYEKNGYSQFGDLYFDAGIEHIMMEKQL